MLPWLLSWPAPLILLKSSFAIRDLLAHALAVQRELEAGDLTRARLAVGRIVGRDVSTLDERGIRRACLESVAESLGDGVVAPLFYAVLGGPALALAYRAVNTLDSMVGYKDEHYLELGWASAKLGRPASWVPARLAALITALAAGMLGLDGGRRAAHGLSGRAQAAVAQQRLARGRLRRGPGRPTGRPRQLPWAQSA